MTGIRPDLSPRKALPSAALLVVALAAAACGFRWSAAERRAVAAVKDYNLVLPKAYSNRNAALLRAVATENERERVATLVSALKGKGWTLDSRQERFGVEEVVLGTGRPRLADVVTAEEWWYRQVGAGGAEVQAPKRVRYRIRYKLIGARDGWAVDRLELLASESLPVTP